MTEYALAYLQRMTEAGLPDSIGLDYNSARECTPRWYGVSFGNGNDGVSHLFPDYYVRCTDPWRLAHIAILSQIVDDYQTKASEALEVDGEEDYTIYAMIRNPLDWDEENLTDEDGEDWCSANGAWMICEVFPITSDTLDLLNDPDIRTHNCYTSMEEAFTADELKLGEE